MQKKQEIKVAYIHARPYGHPAHEAYAKSLNPDYFYNDFLLRWHDVPSSPVKRYLSWLLCALFFPKKKKYQAFYSDGICYFTILMRWLRLINQKQQKVTALMGDETLYFIYSNYYSKKSRAGMVKFLKSYDYLIGVGEMQKELALKVLGKDCPPFYTTFNGVEDSRAKKLTEIKPALESKNIIFIGNITSPTRFLYKGLDILLQSFYEAKKEINDLKLYLIGEIDEPLLNTAIDKYGRGIKKDIIAVGKVNDLETYFSKAALYLHPARGEAWGISILEAMFAGVPPVISEWTGAREVVEKADDELVTPLESSEFYKKIIWYFNLPVSKKEELSEKCRKEVQPYLLSSATKNFNKTFYNAFNEASNS